MLIVLIAASIALSLMVEIAIHLVRDRSNLNEF